MYRVWLQGRFRKPEVGEIVPDVKPEDAITDPIFTEEIIDDEGAPSDLNIDETKAESEKIEDKGIDGQESKEDKEKEE